MIRILPLFLLVASFSAFSQIGVIDYDRKMMSNLNTASLWLIEEGVSTFHAKGKEGIWRKLVDDWGVQIWVDPWIESDRYIDGFWIKARGIHQHVLNFHREFVGNDVYEFWVVNVQVEESTKFKNHAKFFVTKTDFIERKRSILVQSDQFIEEYVVNEDTVLHFPIDNLQILYELTAWRYPNSYELTDIDEKRVEAIGKGLYRVAD